jgi:ribosomal protein S18 acetylase RimI-like enzyme
LVGAATFLDAFAGILDGADIVAHCAANNSTAAFGKWLADAGSIVALAEAATGAAPIGYTVLTAPDLPMAIEPGDIELKRIYTLPRFHGSGLGKALMEQALADARETGRARVLLGVYGKNDRARAFYERHGFVMAGERSFRVGATVHQDVIYARHLRA